MVKKVFPLLLSYVFLTTQCWAISGGPVYGTQSLNVFGLYSGTIIGTSEIDDLSTPSSQPPIPGDTLPPASGTTNTDSSNSLGLFDLSVPATGTSSGNFLLFATGSIYIGTIDASVDPSNGVLQGILQATFGAGSGDNVVTFGTASGKISAIIKASRNTAVTARLTGTAFINISFDEFDETTGAPIVARTLNFSVNGFQQSVSTISSAAAIGTGGNTGSSANTGG